MSSGIFIDNVLFLPKKEEKHKILLDNPVYICYYIKVAKDSRLRKQ